MTRLDGHDGSRYQWAAAPPNLLVARLAGLFWLAWKATQSTSFVDPTMAATRNMADAAGFTHKLLYHWLSSITNPVTQAGHFLNAVGSFGLWGAMLDAEEKGITEAGCLAWCETVEEHLLRPTSIYTGLYVSGGTIWRSKALRQSKYGPRPLHVAAYVSEDNLIARMAALGNVPDYPWHAWQFSSNGPVPGITGRADMNRIDDRAMYDRVCGITDPPPPPPPQQQEQDVPHFGIHSVTGAYWINEIDWVAKEWACPIAELGINWKRWNLPSLPTIDGDALDELYADENHRRPTPQQVIVPIVGTLARHHHDEGSTGPAVAD